MVNTKELLPHLVRGTRVALAIGICILIGLYQGTNQQIVGLIVGALLVGLADFDAPWSHRAINGFAVAVSLSVISFITTYFKNYPLFLLVFVASMFFIIGFLYTTSERFFFLGFFTLAKIAISLSMARDLAGAAHYSVLIFTGGLIYIAMIATLNILFWVGRIRQYWWYDRHEIGAVKKQLTLLRKKVYGQLYFSSEATWGGFKMSSIAVFVVIVGETFKVPEYYWVLLAVVVVLRPVYADTISRAKARFLGTLIGLGIAWVLLELVQAPQWRFFAVFVCSWIAFVFILHTYYIAVIFITPVAILLFSIARYESDVIFYIRAINNIAGVAVAIIGSYIIEKTYANLIRMRTKYARGESAKKLR